MDKQNYLSRLHQYPIAKQNFITLCTKSMQRHLNQGKNIEDLNAQQVFKTRLIFNKASKQQIPAND